MPNFEAFYNGLQKLKGLPWEKVAPAAAALTAADMVAPEESEAVSKPQMVRQAYKSLFGEVDRKALQEAVKRFAPQDVEALKGVYGPTRVKQFADDFWKAQTKHGDWLERNANDFRLNKFLGSLEDDNAYYIPQGAKLVPDSIFMNIYNPQEIDPLQALIHEFGHHVDQQRLGKKRFFHQMDPKRLHASEYIRLDMPDDEIKFLHDMVGRSKYESMYGPVDLRYRQGFGGEVLADAFSAKVLDNPKFNSLDPRIKNAIKDWLPLFTGAGVVGATSQPSEAEAAPSKQKLKASAAILRKWFEDGAHYIDPESGRALNKGMKEWDKLSAIDFITEDNPELKKVITDPDIWGQISNPGDIQKTLGVIEKAGGIQAPAKSVKEVKAPKPKAEVKAEPKAEIEVPKAQEKVKEKVELKISAPKKGDDFDEVLASLERKKVGIGLKFLQKPDEVLWQDSTANRSIEEYGTFKLGGKTVKAYWRPTGTTSQTRFIEFEDGTYAKISKDELRSLVRDRGAEVYTEVFAGRKSEDAKNFQAIHSAELRKKKHAVMPLSKDAKWALRDSYVKNINKLRPERGAEKDKVMVNYRGTVMQIPRSYAEYLYSVGLAKPTGRK